MTEASCSILYPPGPVQLSGPEMEAWLDDLETEICDLFPIDDVEIDGKLWESDPNAEQEEQQQQQQQGVESLSEPDSASSCCLPTAEKCQDSLSKCGAKRRRTGGSGGGKVSRPAKQTDSENLVQELIEENKRLKDQIEHLAAEVQRVRRELIEKVVASS
uniref:DNA damage-inducible transcript 3 protein n=1 Tax=Callorhinchus milii TaxID=7868 RepID=A0A4W3JRH8_CALMI